LKEEALDRVKWRNRFGKGFGPVVWQITDDDVTKDSKVVFFCGQWQHIKTWKNVPRHFYIRTRWRRCSRGLKWLFRGPEHFLVYTWAILPPGSSTRRLCPPGWMLGEGLITSPPPPHFSKTEEKSRNWQQKRAVWTRENETWFWQTWRR
jgi:hypothetical protein